MSTVPILELDGISIAFGGLKALSNVCFRVEKGEIFSVIGPNGAGKTTLFNIVSGVYRPQSGSVKLAGTAVTGEPPNRLAARGLSRSFQNLQIFARMSAAENVMVGRHLKESRNVAAHLLGLGGRDNRASRARAMELLALIGLEGEADTPAGALPYGAAKRLEIARALATEPSLLLLDEPAAGCNPVETGEIEEVIRRIAAMGITVVLVEHDMKLVMRISDRIHVLNYGETLAEGRPQDIRTHPKVVEAYLGRHGAREAAHA
nr:ABC transporter ATP-binding protein [Prosthecomicrobium hirschii]